MKLADIKRECLYCEAPLRLLAKRDIERKKFCSLSCSRKYHTAKNDYSGFYDAAERTCHLFRQRGLI